MPNSAVREAAKAIDSFQLAFLEVAAARLPIAVFILKGGANMRFFFRSSRRSVDIDFDYRGQRFDAFADRVDDVFASRALAELLRERQLQIIDPHRSKQTDTTRRWKLTLRAAAVEEAATKVEFSARGNDSDDYALSQLDPEIARRLGGRPPRVNRYGPVAMVEQKVGALGRRSETQPRDVFDLDVLFRLHPASLGEARLKANTLRAASERALALTYDEYVSTVVNYLEDDLVDVLGSEDAWNEMVLRVSSELDARAAVLER
jgi:hypothetical protein